ncbi:Cof-type HAD-IIB family hydrolase [Desulfuribacillus alkaliarsenatis]|uniref:Hydrolase n=1 Tax=Desulfuribacillus alkaliarsenatis TaxID=766136 RepID=A0A1E5G1H8_9FIRM|nr:Cof-type HAD-IIB family hydrolase [Desulfuribacillus alkaliarsenatis]OEF96682.1 hypothetical protein BHF68_06285 [Desulfuribacillus alkaliarsenatis]
MAKLFENVLLVCDMDGTLLDSSDKISLENKAAMQYFVDNGGSLSIATGRKETSVAPYLHDLPINAPAILYNGSIIYDFDQNLVLWEKSLEDALEELLLRIYNDFKEVGLEIYKDNDILLIRRNSYTEFHRQKEPYLDKEHVLTELELPWRKVLFAAEPDELTKVEAYINSYFNKLNIVTDNMPFRMCRSERFFLEWLPIGVSKGNALEVLKQQFGYKEYSIVTVGNETNDLEMLCSPYVGFAVENAHPEAKEVAMHMCSHHDYHAIANVIEWLESVYNRK